VKFAIFLAFARAAHLSVRRLRPTSRSRFFRSGRLFTSMADVEQILLDLCSELGICFGPEKYAAFIVAPPRNFEAFTDAVLRAAGLDPEFDADIRKQVLSLVTHNLRYPCPCCGYAVHLEPPGSDDICEICYWEDDALQLEFATTLAGGANAPTLFEAQQNFAALGACEKRVLPFVRPASVSDRRDRSWRPIDLTRDSFPVFEEPDRRRAPGRDLRLYYWRSDFWHQ
jgi:hypothetical protein